VLFNMLVGPVFAAGAVTNERERQTLELLLTTVLSPWQILSGKLVSSLRISLVLTSFLVWPILLAWLLPPWTFWHDTFTVLGYLAIILVSSLTTTTLAMFCSVVFRKTSVSMMTAYLLLILLFAAPVAMKLFADLIGADRGTVALIDESLLTSPFAAAFSLPLTLGGREGAPIAPLLGSTATAGLFLGFYLLLDLLFLGLILRLFNVRWRVAG
jgi:ABC-type transport system involved in multi-copper enzyme maturation permease subunit